MTGRTILALATALATATGGAALAQQPMMERGAQAPFEARAGAATQADVERMRDRLERAGFERTRIIGEGVMDAIGPDGQRVLFRIADPVERMHTRPGMGPMAMGPGMQRQGMDSQMGRQGMHQQGMGQPGMGPGMQQQRMAQGMMAGPQQAEQQQRRTENILADALEMAGYTRFERIAPGHLQARATDGRTVTIVFDGGMFGHGRGEAMARQVPEQRGAPQATGAFDIRGLYQAPRLGEAGPREQAIWRDQPVTQTLLNRTQIRNIIEAHGLTDVDDIERLGGNYHASAQRDGETVEVVVDGRTGIVLRPALDPEYPQIDTNGDDQNDEEANGEAAGG